MNAKQIVIFLIVIVGLVGLLVWLGSRGGVAPTVDASDPNRPIATVTTTDYDLGTMAVNEIKQYTFQIKNTGLSDLTLARVTTSCNCTYAYVTVSGRRSPQQTMHGTNGWSDVVRPGETADVEVVYEPALMPVSGAVERTVSVTTTDPVTPTVTFTVRANVKP